MKYSKEELKVINQLIEVSTTLKETVEALRKEKAFIKTGRSQRALYAKLRSMNIKGKLAAKKKDEVITLIHELVDQGYDITYIQQNVLLKFNKILKKHYISNIKFTYLRGHYPTEPVQPKRFIITNNGPKIVSRYATQDVSVTDDVKILLTDRSMQHKLKELDRIGQGMKFEPKEYPEMVVSYLSIKLGIDTIRDKNAILLSQTFLSAHNFSPASIVYDLRKSYKKVNS